MGALKATASLLVRFSLCFALIACLWIVSISYRIGPFHYEGSPVIGNLTFAVSDGLFLAGVLALLIGLSGLYRSGRISAVLMVLVSLAALASADHLWAVYGYFDDLKAVPRYVVQPAILAVLICPWSSCSRRGVRRTAGCWPGAGRR